MKVSKEVLLNALPIYRDKWVTITGEQTVGDIVHEVVRSHELFARYYDQIARFFPENNPVKLADQLFDFCRENIRYQEESEEEQTTSVPQGILYRGHGDCKHYAGFIAGILDAKNRTQDCNFDWCYRFASYNILRKQPHHVFVVVKNKDAGEIWIDPTPGSFGAEPVFFTDKKPKNMALQRAVAGFDNMPADYIYSAGVDANTLQVANYGGQWYAWDKNGPIDLYQYGKALQRVGSFADGLQQAGVNVATTSANAVFPGSGDVIQTAVTAILSLFKNSDKPAQQKIWQMFPISQTPTAQEVAMQINAALQHALTGSPADYTKWDANWQDAYGQMFQKYTQLYNQLTGKNYPVPPYFPPQQGYVFPGGAPAGSGLFSTSGAPNTVTSLISKNALLIIGLVAGGYLLYKWAK